MLMTHPAFSAHNTRPTDLEWRFIYAAVGTLSLLHRDLPRRLKVEANAIGANLMLGIDVTVQEYGRQPRRPPLSAVSEFE